MPKNNPHTKSKKCGARTRAGGECKQPAMSNGRCRMHGGMTPMGDALPQTKSGRYSKLLPKDLVPLYEQALGDPQLLHLSSELALLDTEIAKVLRRLASSETARHWSELKDARTELRKAQATSDVHRLHRALNKIDEVLEGSYEAEPDEAKLLGLIEQRRKLVDSESRRQNELSQTVKLDKLIVLFRYLGQSVVRHVPDQKAVQAIHRDMQKILNDLDAA